MVASTEQAPVCLKLNNPPSFDQLILRLKEKIGDEEFLEFFKKMRAIDSTAQFDRNITSKIDAQIETKFDFASAKHMAASASRNAPAWLASDSSDLFRYSSLESNPEKEFENAKWIVLTTAQPCIDDDVAEKQRNEKHAAGQFDKLPSQTS